MDNYFDDEVINDLTSQSQLEKDLKFIKGEVFAKQKNGKYCKISKVLKCIIITNMTKEQHINYWMNTYRKRPKEEQEAILKAINWKLDDDLISLDKAIEIEENSKEIEKEKKKVLEEITKEN